MRTPISTMRDMSGKRESARIPTTENNRRRSSRITTRAQYVERSDTESEGENSNEAPTRFQQPQGIVNPYISSKRKPRAAMQKGRPIVNPYRNNNIALTTTVPTVDSSKNNRQKRLTQDVLRFTRRPDQRPWPHKTTNGPILEDTPAEVKDNSHWGERMNPEPEEGRTRIYFQNINGLRTGDTFNDVNEIFMQAAGSNIGIFGFAETNVPWHERRVYKSIRSKLNKHWNAGKLSASSSPMLVGEHFYQPGGVATFVTGDWTGRVADTSEDTSGMGRWATIELQGKRNSRLSIITAYRPTKADITTAGEQTVYASQWNMMRAAGIEEPDPRQQFLDDLRDYILQLKQQKQSVLLMMDANEATESKNSKLQQFFIECGITDLHANRHRNLASPPNTYIRGSTSGIG